MRSFQSSQFDAFLNQWIQIFPSRDSLVKTQNCQSCFDWLVLKSKQRNFDDYWEQLTLRSFQKNLFVDGSESFELFSKEFHSSLRSFKRSSRFLAERCHQHIKRFYCLQLKLGNKVRDLFLISRKAFNILQIHHFIDFCLTRSLSFFKGISA